MIVAPAAGQGPVAPAPMGPRKIAEIPKDFIFGGAKSEDIARKTLHCPRWARLRSRCHRR